MVVSYLAMMVLLFTGKIITYAVNTHTEYISAWLQHLQSLSFTVNSLEHISSATHCLPPHAAAHFVSALLHGECQQLASVNSMKYFHGNMFSCLNFNQTLATPFSARDVFWLWRHAGRGAVFLALICSCSHEHHQIFTVPSLMSQLSLLLASFISSDTEKKTCAFWFLTNYGSTIYSVWII